MAKKQIIRELNHYIKDRRKMHKTGFFKKIFSKKKKELDSADIPIDDVDRVLAAAGQKVERVPADKIIVKEPEQGPVLESKEEVVFKDAELVVEQKEEPKEEDRAQDSSEQEVLNSEESELKEAAETPSFFHKFRSMFRKKPVSEQEKEIEEEYEQAEEALESADSEPGNSKEVIVNADHAVNDVKESLRIAFNTISMLSKESYDEFRTSEDFKKYKFLVEKYNFNKV